MLRVLQQQIQHRTVINSAHLLRIRGFATDTESAIEQKLQKALSVQHVEVRDTSGGCGTMFQIRLVAQEFQNKSIVQQHKVVTKVLKDDISQWHGFTLLTSAPTI